MASAMESSQLTVEDFTRILRTGWRTIAAAVGIAVLCALAYSLLATPKYAASTRLFVTTTEQTNATQLNDGGFFVQRRVLSYTKLLSGELLAQRTIDKLNLNMTPAQLLAEVTAVAPNDTVLIDVTVVDPSPARARDIANTLSDEFIVMAAELETPDVGERPTVDVIVQQRATTPDRPVTPKKKINLALGLILGAVLGVGLAIVRDLRNTTVRSPKMLDAATGLGMVGDIPFDAQRRKEPFISFARDYSPIAEAFRELRINVQHLEVADGPRVLLVASSGPQEGRTTTAINLALALAEAGYEVALVDGDLRRPRIAPWFHIDSGLGLTTVLTGEATLQEALQGTGFPGLTVLTAGATPASPAEVLGSRAAQDTFGELGRQFDYVVIDTPPVLVTDAALLSASSQGVLLIARFGKTDRGRLASAANALRQSAAPLIGAVLTMTPPKKRKPDELSYFGIAGDPGGKAPARGSRWLRGRHEK